MRKTVQRPPEFVHRRVFDDDSADRPRPSVRLLGLRAQRNRLARRIEHPRVIDLRQIVILGGEPEHRNRRRAAIRKLLGEPRGGYRFINRIRRTRKKPDLLPGDDRNRSRLRQPIEIRARSILRGERVNHRGAAAVGIVDFPSGGPERFEIMRIVAIKASDPVKMIGKINEQPGGSRQIGMSDTGWFHCFLDA